MLTFPTCKPLLMHIYWPFIPQFQDLETELYQFKSKMSEHEEEIRLLEDQIRAIESSLSKLDGTVGPFVCLVFCQSCVWYLDIGLYAEFLFDYDTCASWDDLLYAIKSHATSSIFMWLGTCMWNDSSCLVMCDFMI